MDNLQLNIEKQMDTSKKPISRTHVIADLTINLLQTRNLTRGLRVKSAITKEIFRNPHIKYLVRVFHGISFQNYNI